MVYFLHSLGIVAARFLYVYLCNNLVVRRINYTEGLYIALQCSIVTQSWANAVTSYISVQHSYSI